MGLAVELTMAAIKKAKRVRLVESDERLLSAQQQQLAHLQQA